MQGLRVEWEGSAEGLWFDLPWLAEPDAHWAPKLIVFAGKVTLLPHMGSATIEGRVEMGEKVIINIRTFLDNHKPPDRVLPSML